MKKTITVIALLAGAVSGYSQGQVYFYGYAAEGSPASTLHQAIYGLQTGTYSVTYGGSTVLETVGSTTAVQNSKETPTGTAVYTSTPLGGMGPAADAILLEGAAGDTLSQLTPVGTVLPFYTTAAGVGFIKGAEIETLASVPFSTTITIAIAAWNVNAGGDQNGGAAVTTLAEAIAASTADVLEANDGGYGWGISATVSDTTAASGLPPTPMPTTLESFSLGQAVPEPSTIALGVIGASALLFRRRK
jgi:hypothetical protein